MQNIVKQGGINTSILNTYLEYRAKINPHTERAYINDLRQFVAWLRYESITDPTRADLLRFRDYLLNEHEAIELTPDGWQYRKDRNGRRYKVICKPATVVHYMGSVKRFFKWREENYNIPTIYKDIDTPRIDRRTHKKDALQPADVKAIENTIIAKINAADGIKREQAQRLHAMFLLAVTAGMRTAELSSAKVKDIETRSGRAHIYIKGKGHSEADERLPIAKEVYRTIKEYLDNRSTPATPGSPLFTATGNRSGGRSIAPTTISTILKRALIAAGYDSDRLTAHSLRHTTGTAIHRITKDLYLTQQYMRHKDPATTEIYLHESTAEEQAAIAEALYKVYQEREIERTENTLN